MITDPKRRYASIYGNGVGTAPPRGRRKKHAEPDVLCREVYSRIVIAVARSRKLYRKTLNPDVVSVLTRLESILGDIKKIQINVPQNVSGGQVEV